MPRTGFLESMSPSAKASMIIKSDKAFSNGEFASMVAEHRALWDDDYGNRVIKTPFTREELLTAKDQEVLVSSGKTVEGHSVSTVLFTAVSGHWMFQLTEHKGGKKDWSFNVWAGNTFVSPGHGG